MKRRISYKLLLLLLAPFIVFSALHAQWLENGISICTSSGDQRSPEVASDTRLGAIVVWDCGGVQAQRINEFGDILWGGGGVTVSSGNTSQHTISPDGLGGAIVVWTQFKMARHQIYAQHVSPNGTPLWGSKGLIVCEGTWDQNSPRITRTDTDHFVIAWEDDRGTDKNIYMQKIDGGGNILWQSEGMAVTEHPGDQKLIGIVPDDAGGMIVAWEDSPGSDVDIYAQRLDGSGLPRWTADGIAVCSEPGNQSQAVITDDGQGGLIAVWQDTRGSGIDIYAQRIDLDGTRVWPTGGTVVCSAPKDQIRPGIVADKTGGAIVSWCDYRGDDADIFVQRINATGDQSWQQDGVALCSLEGNQLLPRIAPDRYGGAIVTWQDQRSADWNIYAQRVTEGGSIQWDDDGLLVCNAPYEQLSPVIAPDGSGGAIMPWEDTRNGEIDIFAQRIDAEGHIVREVLTRYSAHLDGHNIVVKWKMSGEKSNQRFFVFRAHSIYGPYRSLLVGVVCKGNSYSFVDETCREGEGYTYRVELLNGNYRKLLFQTQAIVIPKKERVRSWNSPNPCNPSTTIYYTLPNYTHVKLDIFDVAGRKIACLVDGPQGPGEHRAVWNGRDGNGVPLTSGIYFYRIAIGTSVVGKKMILVR
jgi:hypothetical protein